MTDAEWRKTVEQRLYALEQHKAVESVHRTNVEKRLSAIEDTLKWLMRLVIGGLLMAVLAFVFNGGLAVVTP